MKKKNILKRNSGFIVGCVLAGGASFFAADIVMTDVLPDLHMEKETDEPESDTEAVLQPEKQETVVYETDPFTVMASGSVIKGVESEQSEAQSETQQAESGETEDGQTSGDGPSSTGGETSPDGEYISDGDDSYYVDSSYTGDDNWSGDGSGSSDGSWTDDGSWSDGSGSWTDDGSWSDGSGGDSGWSDGSGGWTDDGSWSDGSSGGDSGWSDGSGGDSSWSDGSGGGDSSWSDGSGGGDSSWSDGSGGDSSWSDGSGGDSSWSDGSDGDDGSGTDGAWTPEDVIIQGISSRYIDVSELYNYDQGQLRLIRNEIFALNGRIFNSQDLMDYFSQKSWYVPTYTPEEFDANWSTYLNDYERANLQVILDYEAALGY